MADDENDGGVAGTLKGWWGKLTGEDEKSIGDVAAEAARETAATLAEESDGDQQSGGSITDAIDEVTDYLTYRADQVGAVIRQFGEGDPDEDNLTTAEEFRHGTNPWNRDTDGDQRGDGAEVHGGSIHTVKTDPLNKDTDNDGLNDGTEIIITGTDPTNPDTDGDTWPDGQERMRKSTDPLDPDSHPEGTGPLAKNMVADAVGDLTDFVVETSDRIGEAVKEFAESDSDGDLLTNADELAHGTNPWDRDTDNDGESDGVEVLISHTDPTEPPILDQAIDSVKDFAQQVAEVDSDADGLSDISEFLGGTRPDHPDTDDDGLTDGWEVRHDTDPQVPDNPIETPHQTLVFDEPLVIEEIDQPEPFPPDPVQIDEIESEPLPEAAPDDIFDAVDDSMDALTADFDD